MTDTGWVDQSVRDFVAASAQHVHVPAPAEVAAVIVYLCSDQAHLITGNVITLR